MSETVWADYPGSMIVSASIFEQLPIWAKSTYQNFADFLEAYFEWMESSNNVLFHAKKIRDYRDIDKTITQFVEHFEAQYLKNIPTKLYDDTSVSGIKVDKATLLKNAKKFYSAKGSEKSYKLLFRILFNEDVQFYYPKVDMLYASDGKWNYNKIVRVVTTGIDVFDFVGREITGLTSGATAAVENAYLISIDGTSVGELFLNHVIGTFTEEETISCSAVSAKLYNMLSAITITNPGTGYAVGDSITISGSGIGEEAEISEVRGPLSTTVDILDPGSGYEDVPKVTIVGTGFGGKGHATLVSTGVSRIEVLNGGSGYNDSVPPTVVFPVTSNTPTAFATVEGGEIVSVTMITSGTGYTSIPEITFDDSANGNAGVNALVRAYLVPTELQSIVIDNVGRDYTSEGGVTINFTGGLTTDSTSYHAIVSGLINGGVYKVKITNPGITASSSTAPTISFINASGTGATATASLSSLFTFDGEWVTTDGFLSSDKYLQDSYYYQVFSYVLKSTKALSDYKDIVKKILHPAGLILFGSVLIETLVQIGPTHRTIERNKFWYPPYDGHRERPDYNLTFPAPNASYWVSPYGLGNTQIGNWDDVVIGDVIDEPLKRTNLAPDPYVNVYNPDYSVPEAWVEYDMIEGLDNQVLYDITPDPEYNGILGSTSSTDGSDPSFISTGVKFEGTYIDCSTVPINPLEQSIVVVFKMDSLTANTSILGCIDVNKDTTTTGYSVDVDVDGSLKMRTQMRTITNVTYNASADYPAGTIVVGDWNMGVLRYANGEITANHNLNGAIVQNFGIDPYTIGISNNSSGWFIGNQGYVPPTAGSSLWGQVLYGTNLYFGSGSYNSTTTYTNSFWDESLFWDKPWDGASSTEITIVEPLPGRPFLDGAVAYVLLYDRLITDDEIIGIYNSLKSALASRPVDLP
jgi:predicted nucleic acid-binding Zn ribbon protein